MNRRLTDVDRARALLDERDGELRANLRGDVAALALAFRRIRREARASDTSSDPRCWCDDATTPHRRSVCEATRIQRRHEATR